MFVTKFDISSTVSGDSLSLMDYWLDEGNSGRSNFCQTFGKGILLLNLVPGANKHPADNAGGFRRLAFNRPANGGGNEKKQQVNTALRLSANR